MDLLQAKANYSRICQLLVDKGGDVLRGAFQTNIHTSPPPSTVDSLLKANKRSLQRIRYSVISAAQWKLLFPASGSSDSNNFDITLLTILLRNICGLPSPAAGWNVMPPASDTSISAEILRIKIIRNEIYGHISSAQLDDTKFETLWLDISKPLIKLGIPQQDIDELKEAPLSPEEESYIEKLKEWKELEDDLFSKLNDVEGEVVMVKKRVIDIGDSVANVENEVVKLRAVVENVKSSGADKLAKFFFKGKIEELSKKFQDGTRKWFFGDFEKWLDDERSSVMILTAGPGIGKSVLSAKVCELYQKRGQLAACHFCDFRTSDYRDPHRILQALASQMCDNVDGFRDKLTEVLSREHSRDSLSDAFRVLLKDPLHALDRREPMLIVVDALDESKTANKSEFLDLISDEFSPLPKWIKIFISSRPELQVRKKLEHLNPLEILPDDKQHNLDLEQFIQSCLPKISRPRLMSVIVKCAGSFLYAYYLVNEVKQSGIEQNVDEYIPKGISAFYEKQFQRLKTELQRYEQNTEVSIFKSFLNVVAASEGPLPFRILFACMGLSNEVYEIREAIIGIMSEILPVYDGCLTVCHKSLWDWLRLDEEHAYAADVADGERRLWRACKKVYADIASLSSVSDFQISPEKMYALENGWNHLMNVGGTEDFVWLVNVKVNYFKFEYDDADTKYLCAILFDILQEYKSTLPDHLYWRIFQLFNAHNIIDELFEPLQYFANKQFGFVESATTCTKDTKDTRDILDQINFIWLEEVRNETDSRIKIISNDLLKHSRTGDAISSSPDNKLLAVRHGKQVVVYKLPSLTIIFKLDVSQVSGYSRYIVFSPDSSYFLLGSVQTCVSVEKLKEVPFIPHGPAETRCCSFSSCGTKLATTEQESIKVWDVRKKEILVESKSMLHLPERFCVSSFGSYIFVFTVANCHLKVLDSTTLNSIEITKTHAFSSRDDNYVQLISPPPSANFVEASFRIEKCWQLPTGENILWTLNYCSKPFTWKGRKCVMTSNGALSLVVYDYINQEVVDTFQISCLPSYKSIDYLTNVGENNFLICLDGLFVFVLSLESSSESFASPFLGDEAYPIFCALSPDNLYLAYSYGYPILKIMYVDNGTTLQTVAPKQMPIACWWSELYLWVVCEGPVVVKHPYNSTETHIVGNDVEECSIDCKGHVLKFQEGVLVTQLDGKISISKICHENLCPQQILDSKSDTIFSDPEVAVSSDGCAVLLYDTYHSCYELWEMGCEDRWELLSTETFDYSIFCGCLTGKQNSRSSLWLSNHADDVRLAYDLSSIDFPNATRGAVHKIPRAIFTRGDVPKIPTSIEDGKFIYVGSDLLICHAKEEIYFFHVSDGNIITSIYVGDIDDSFFVPSKRLLLLFIGSGVIKHFKVHNIDEYLPL